MGHHHDQKHKHLRQVLTEDQEPFLLHKHIAHKRYLLKTTTPTKKHNLFISQTSSSTSKHVSFLCRKACFLSFSDSPDFKKSPFPLPPKSPCKVAASRFLHIPVKTAAMLLEAAIKIQSTKPKTQAQSVTGFGLLGSFFKKLRNINKARKREICVNDACTTKVEENNPVFSSKKVDEISEVTRRVSSAGWSESNQGKSLDMESCSTTSRSDCSSPTSSPFHFALQRTLTPHILSPVASPICPNNKDDEHDEGSLQKIPVPEEAEQDQCSPVSVLDPPFEDDDEQNGGDEEDEEDSDFDVECSYAIVQRAKLQLLHKLRRFERLAELDPVELEKRMTEDQEDDDEEEECDYGNDLETLYMHDLDEIVREVLSRSIQFDQDKIPSDVRRLFLNLIAEERESEPDCSVKVIVSSVCKRLNAWKEVESNTIDMMVEWDFRKDVDGWTQYEEEVGDRARDIELSIFGLLVEELVS